MDEKTREANLKDLKIYRLIIVFVFLIVIAIALIVGKVTINSYSTEAYFTNSFLNILMDKEITSVEEINGRHITFTREINKDFDAKKDQPIDAFIYYSISEDGKTKNKLDHGMFYPAEYYKKDSKVTPVFVAAGFLLSAQKNLEVLSNVLTVVAVLIALAFIALLIYLWYRSWCKREDKRQAMLRESR